MQYDYFRYKLIFMNTGSAIIQLGKKTRQEFKKAYEKANKYVPNFIDPNEKRVNWLKLIFWVNVVIVFVMLAFISTGEWV